MQKRLVGDSDDEMQVDQQAAQDSFAEDSDEGQYAPAKKTAPAAKKAPAKGKGKGKEQSLVSNRPSGVDRVDRSEPTQR